MKRVLLLLPTTGYRNRDFLAAANKLGRSLARVARDSAGEAAVGRTALAVHAAL